MAISTTDVNIILERLEGITAKSRRGATDATPMVAPGEPVSPTAFLRDNDLLGAVPELELRRFVELGECRKFPAGARLFEAGDPCDRIFAVKSGILEILRDCHGEDDRAALLGVGEVVGLIGALTGGQHRSSGVFPEGGEVLILDGPTFAAKLELLPNISAAMVRMLAGRLMGAVKNSDLAAVSKRQLEGSLEHFDLAAVLQNLLANESSAGTLTILDEHTDAIADILLGCGRIVACRFGDLTEIAAFQRLFLVDHSKHRFFYMESEEAGRAAECCELGLGGMTGMGLLMDCARLVDECRRLEDSPLANEETRLRRLPGQARWSDRATQALFRRLLRQLMRECSVGEVLAGEVEDRLRVISVLDQMLAEGMIEVVS